MVLQQPALQEQSLPKPAAQHNGARRLWNHRMKTMQSPSTMNGNNLLMIHSNEPSGWWGVCVCVYVCAHVSVRVKYGTSSKMSMLLSSPDCGHMYVDTCTWNMCVCLTSSSSRACLFFLLAWSCLCSSCSKSSLRCSLPCCSNKISSSTSSCSLVWTRTGMRQQMVRHIWPKGWIPTSPCRPYCTWPYSLTSPRVGASKNKNAYQFIF